MDTRIFAFLAALSLFLPATLMIVEAHQGTTCTYYHPPRACSNAAYNSCYTIACHSYASCQDGNPYTTNNCINADTTSSYCSSSTCNSGTADVNNNPSDGCEVNLNTDPSNCGSVGNVCPSGVCQSGICADFSLSIDPSVGLANKGDTKLVNVTLTKITGTLSPTLSAIGLPAGTSIAFSPSSCTPTCNSNAIITTTGSTPTGSNIISIRATVGSLTKTAPYNLTILPSSVATCGNLVCEYPETQSSCTSDCFTTANMPSSVSPGEVVSVSVEFRDFRYLANGKVKIDLSIDGTTTWNVTNGCSIGGIKMGPSSGGGAIQWPSGTISENGHFKITALCTIPNSISSGSHTLFATPTIF